MNLIESAKSQIIDLLNAACEQARLLGNLPAGGELRGSIEVPRDPSHGDYAATHAMSMAKEMRLPPRKIAEILTANIDVNGTYFKSISIAGAGFINFTVSANWYSDVMKAVEKMGTDYGFVNLGEGKQIMVEFVSANPTGPMTVGNARGGALGDTLAAVFEKAGYSVWREFLINDAGNQVDLFGKSINARYLQLVNGKDSVEFPEDGYHGEDITELAAIMVHQHGNKLLELPEEERIKLFIEFGIPHNVALMKEHLERYRIHFDEWFSESSLHTSRYVEETVELLDKAGLLFEKDGAVWLRNTQLGGDKDEVIVRGNGFYTYYALDIAYHRNKLDRGFDKVIDIWGADHHGHAIRLMATMTSAKLCEALKIDGTRLHFLLNQMMRIIKDGETVKVSKRTGKALTLSDLLDEISVDACRFFFNARPDSHLDFDMNLAVRQDSENPVYYVQYAHARICTLIENLANEGHKVPSIKEVITDLLTLETEQELIKQISALPEEVILAVRDMDPSRINRYVVELASRFHKFYSSCRIKGAKRGLLMARLKLADTTRLTIKTCLELLGITAPEKM